MLPLLVAPFLFNEVVGNILPGLPIPTRITDDTRSSITKRSDAIPTINLGDIRQYVFDQGARHPDVPTLGKRDVSIAPEGFHSVIPENGITIGLGEEIAEEVRKIVEEKCKDDKNLQVCIGEVHQTLARTQLNTHTKRFVLLTAGAVAVFIEWVIPAIIALGAVGGAVLIESNKQAKVHLPHEENGPLAQIENLGDDVSEVAFSTGNGDEVDLVATVTITPTPTPTPNPDRRISLEEITADSGEDKKGDVLIHIPEDLDRRLKDYLGVLGLQQVRDACEEDRKVHAISKRSSIGSRADEPPPVTERCRTAIRDLSRSGMFALDDETNMQMVPANPDNPANLETHPDGAAVPVFNIDEVNAAIMLARQYQERRGANGRPGVNPFYRSLMVASLVLRYVQEVSLVVNDIQEVVSIIKWSVENIQRVTQKDAECQPDLVCFSEDCKGYEEKRAFLAVDEEPYLKQTGSCTMKSNKGCSCEVLSEPIVRQIPDGYFENLQQFMQDIDDSVSHPTCSTDDSINFDTARFDEAIDGACHDHNELRRKKRHGAAISKRDDFAYYNTDKDNLRWKLSWDDGGSKCALKCEDVFKQMLYYDKCRWWGGAAKKGSVPTECGQASYEVDYVPPPAPPPPPSEPPLPEDWAQYLIILDHEISGPGNWKLTWTLFADPWRVNAKVEGPATYFDVGATSMEIHINVDDSDNKDKAKIRFTIADRFNPSEKRNAPWYAGPNGDMGQEFFGINWCGIAEKNSDWHDDNGVWKRKVRCAFSKYFEEVYKTGKFQGIF